MIPAPVSRRNPHARWVRTLQTEPKTRREEGLWVVEGPRLVREALGARLTVRLWVFAEGRLGSRPDIRALWEAAASSGQECVVVSDDAFRGLADTREPQGVLCVVEMPRWAPADFEGVPGPVVVLDGLQDPGNLGTLARSAEAAGAAALVLGRETADPGNPKALRASSGSLFRLPFLAVDDVQGVLEGSGRNVYGTTGRGGVPYDQVDLSRPFFLLVGQEGRGLSPELVSRCSRLVTIPMGGGVESLNAATAAAVLLFEAGRQRRAR